MAYFHRPPLARELARRLLKPGLLDQGLRSGLFLAGLRRTGKTTFLRQDLIPALEAEGAIVIYVDLWADTQSDPASLVRTAIRGTLEDLQAPGSGLLARLARLKGLEFGAGGLRFGFQLDALAAKGGATLAQVLSELVDAARTDLVLVVDEVQQALATPAGQQMLLAHKAARDAINPRPGTPGHLLFIGTGSHRAQVAEMTHQRQQAFVGAVSLDYPRLGADYVAFVLDGLRLEGAKALPGEAVALAAFERLGHRPEDFMRALLELQKHPAEQADALLPVIAGALQGAAADVELRKVEDLGALAIAIFDRIAQSEEGIAGHFSAAVVEAHARTLGQPVTTEQVQRMLDELRNANLVMRRGHGLYAVTDPFVRDLWRGRRAMGVENLGGSAA